MIEDWIFYQNIPHEYEETLWTRNENGSYPLCDDGSVFFAAYPAHVLITDVDGVPSCKAERFFLAKKVGNDHWEIRDANWVLWMEKDIHFLSTDAALDFAREEGIKLEEVEL